MAAPQSVVDISCAFAANYGQFVDRRCKSASHRPEANRQTVRRILRSVNGERVMRTARTLLSARVLNCSEHLL